MSVCRYVAVCIGERVLLAHAYMYKQTYAPNIQNGLGEGVVVFLSSVLVVYLRRHAVMSSCENNLTIHNLYQVYFFNFRPRNVHITMLWREKDVTI